VISLVAFFPALAKTLDQNLLENIGGERGIRTPDTRKGIHAFEARAFSHSAISPRR
jgi:hypothetical protein